MAGKAVRVVLGNAHTAHAACCHQRAQASEAIDMLRGACELAASHYGEAHPSCAGVMLDTREALQVGWLVAGGVLDATVGLFGVLNCTLGH